MKRLMIGVTASVAALLIPSVCGATVWVDPATLHIGTGAGSSCAQGCGGDPNIVPTNNVDIYQNSGGAGALNNPVLLILAIPNDTTDLFATNPITSDQFINPYPGGTTSNGTSGFASPSTYGLKSNVSGDPGFFGTMGSGQEVYSFLQVKGPTDNSNSFVNWSGADKTDLGITANSYGIYVFALTSGSSNPLSGGGLINITFASALPTGSIMVAYGQDQANMKIYDTPFTEAGMTSGNGVGITSVAAPEPASLMLLGSGLLVAGTRLRRKKRAL